MSHQEEFADPVVVPGPNVRSRFTDTEEVDDDATELVVDAARLCPTCHGVFSDVTLVCPDDGTALRDLPPAT